MAKKSKTEKLAMKYLNELNTRCDKLLKGVSYPLTYDSLNKIKIEVEDVSNSKTPMNDNLHQYIDEIGDVKFDQQLAQDYPAIFTASVFTRISGMLEEIRAKYAVQGDKYVFEFADTSDAARLDAMCKSIINEVSELTTFSSENGFSSPKFLAMFEDFREHFISGVNDYAPKATEEPVIIVPVVDHDVVALPVYEEPVLTINDGMNTEAQLDGKELILDNTATASVMDETIERLDEAASSLDTSVPHFEA